MSSTFDVADFHADYDAHPDDRIRLFGAVDGFVNPAAVLYPGSYVDIAPSVFFADVHYVDTDKRANRFFKLHADVARLIQDKRGKIDRPSAGFAFRFDASDYREPLGIKDGSVDLLISLYAGFVSEHCTRYLSERGYLLANNSHGDASMASLDHDYELSAVINSRGGVYKVATSNLDTYLIPKRGEPPTIESLRTNGRGIAYTKSPFAYIFRRT